MAPLRFHEYHRRGLLPLAGLALAAYYLLVLLPLGQKAEKVEAPLQKAWQRLAVSLGQATNAASIDFLLITNQYRETRQALAALEAAKTKARTYLELSPTVRARISAPFQYLEYENERSKNLEDLTKRAAQQQTVLEPPVLAGFPEYTAEVREPELLWAALSVADALASTALQCKVAAIHSLAVPLALTNAPSPPGVRRLSEVPLEIEFTTSAASAAGFIQSLPRRGEELRASGLPEVPADKPPLYIDRLVIRKQSPEKPDEVRVALRAIAFVLRD
jgi:hypothetical protein